MPDIDPWGDVDVGDYQEKMEQFGIEPIETVADRFPDHKLIRRGIVFGHRGMDEVFDRYEDGEELAMMTGIMPSGVFHLGHKSVVDQILLYQEMGATITLTAADIEAYTTRNMPLDEARELVIDQYLTNYVALGIDLENVDFYFQTGGGNDYHARSKLFSRYITQNEFDAVYGNTDPGKITAALTQYADIFRPQFPENGGSKPTVVPVGVDQDPHIRLTRDVAARYRDQDLYKPASTYHKFMRGLQGGKMSSSREKSYIALTDSVEDAKAKIDAAKTGGRQSIEEHREKGANIAEDMVFELLAFHLIDDDDELERIREEYSAGEMTSGEIKQIAKDRIEDLLVEHHRRREEAVEIVDQYIDEHDI